MDDMNLTAAATLALLIQYFIFSLFVGAARYKTGVKAPATTGAVSYTHLTLPTIYSV